MLDGCWLPVTALTKAGQDFTPLHVGDPWHRPSVPALGWETAELEVGHKESFFQSPDPNFLALQASLHMFAGPKTEPCRAVGGGLSLLKTSHSLRLWKMLLFRVQTDIPADCWDFSRDARVPKLNF